MELTPLPMLYPTFTVKNVSVDKFFAPNTTATNAKPRPCHEVTMHDAFDAQDIKEIDSKFPGCVFKLDTVRESDTVGCESRDCGSERASDDTNGLIEALEAAMKEGGIHAIPFCAPRRK